MTRLRAARQLRHLRRLYFAAPAELRKLLRHWLVKECKTISRCAHLKLV